MSIKSISGALSITVCAGLLSSNLFATIIKDDLDGLSSPGIIFDFGVNAHTIGTLIDDEYVSSGVTFGPTFVYGNADVTSLNITQGHLTNLNTADVQPGGIFFTSDVTAAAFSWRTGNALTVTEDVETLFSAYNDNVLVEEFRGISNASVSFDSGRYFGFENILFDEIRLSLLVEGTMDPSPDKFFTLDNLEYTSAVPVPAAVWLFGSGLLGLIGFARHKR